MIVLVVAFSIFPLVISLALASLDRSKWWLVALSIVVVGFVSGAAIWTFRDVRPAEYTITKPTELERMIQILWFASIMLPNFIAIALGIMLWCLWKMAYLLYRYSRWERTAKQSGSNKLIQYGLNNRKSQGEGADHNNTRDYSEENAPPKSETYFPFHASK